MRSIRRHMCSNVQGIWTKCSEEHAPWMSEQIFPKWNELSFNKCLLYTYKNKPNKIKPMTFSVLECSLVHRAVYMLMNGLALGQSGGRLLWVFHSMHSNISLMISHFTTPIYYPYFITLYQLDKGELSKVSNLGTSTWQWRSTARSNSGVQCKCHWSDAVWLATIERGKSGDTITFLKLISLLFLSQS